MADEKDGLAKPDENWAAYSGPAFWVNRFHITTIENAVRIAFAERVGASNPYQFRSAVVMIPEDAIALRDALTELLEPDKGKKNA